MFKKLMIASAILAISSNVAFAVAPYVGASTGVKVNTSTDRNYRGVPANLFIGVGGQTGNGLYLAGEVFSTVATGTISDNHLKSTYSYGVSFIPGVMISDHTMGYARLGAVRTRFISSGLANTTITGAQAGAGLQTNLMQSWDLRGEYVYTAYNKLSGVNGSPRADEFNLGLVYKFE